MLIYATACGIGTDLYKGILKKLRSKKAQENMEQDGVNPSEQNPSWGIFFKQTFRWFEHLPIRPL